MRALNDADAKKLKPGDEHYLAYVGPPERYDLLGAMQFRLLTALGLREHHRLLDFGCGSLRAGRLFIPYLSSGNYHGIDPNAWLIEDGITNHLGKDILQVKRPVFAYNSDFSIPFLDRTFDFILAQSVFSHCGVDLKQKLLVQFAERLNPDGLAAVTFSISNDTPEFDGNGWIYPNCVRYKVGTILNAASCAGLKALPIPFFHPSQQWFLMAKNEAMLPKPEQLPLLTGPVFNVNEFSASLTIPSIK